VRICALLFAFVRISIGCELSHNRRTISAVGMMFAVVALPTFCFYNCVNGSARNTHLVSVFTVRNAITAFLRPRDEVHY